MTTGTQFPVQKTDDQWRDTLSPEQYRVLRGHGTERAFTSPLNHEKRQGTFVCAGCRQLLFSSDTKYESGTGWPSFYRPLEGAVGTTVDRSLFTVRIEVHCARCGGHLGHVFPDGPPPTGERYCMNGVAMNVRAEAISGDSACPPVLTEVWAALAWGAVSSAGLLAGAIAGSFFRMPHRAIAMAMSVGAGLLLAGVSLKVAADAIRIAGPVAAALSLLLGAAIFSASNALLARFGAAHRKRCGECVPQPVESQQPGSGVAIALGNALDGLPEALVLGIALRHRGRPRRAGVCVLSGQLSRGFIERSGDAACRPQLHLHPLALECGRHWGGDSSRGRVCRVHFAQWRVATAAASIWRRSTARDDGGDDDSRSLSQQSAFLRLARRRRFRSPAARRRYDALVPTDLGEERFPYFHDVRGQLRAFAVADVLRCVSRAAGMKRTSPGSSVTGGLPSTWYSRGAPSST